MARRAKKKKKRRNFDPHKPRKCINCGKPGPHFVPPSFGEKGFFTCENKEDRNG